MYPLPVASWKPSNRVLYKISLPVALIIWLLPLLAVLVTSIRSSDELMQGNYWGWPHDFAALQNYRTVLVDSPERELRATGPTSSRSASRGRCCSDQPRPPSADVRTETDGRTSK